MVLLDVISRILEKGFALNIGDRHIMKNKIGFIGILLFLSMAAAASAGDISGKWYAPMEGVYVEIVFKVDGTSLTGTMDNPRSGKTKIKDGKIEGDNFSFYVTRNLGIL